MRFLRTFLAAVGVRLFWQILLAESLLDIATRHTDRISRQVGRVGTHVSDVARLVQALGHHHGLLHAKAQARAGSLLQCGGNKRCIRARAGWLVFALEHAVVGFFQHSECSICLRLVGRPEGLSGLLDHLKAHGFSLRRMQLRMNFPELFRNKGANLTLAIYDQLHCH